MKDEAGRILKGELPGSEKFLLIQTLREMKKGNKRKNIFLYYSFSLMFLIISFAKARGKKAKLR